MSDSEPEGHHGSPHQPPRRVNDLDPWLERWKTLWVTHPLQLRENKKDQKRIYMIYGTYTSYNYNISHTKLLYIYIHIKNIYIYIYISLITNISFDNCWNMLFCCEAMVIPPPGTIVEAIRGQVRPQDPWRRRGPRLRRSRRAPLRLPQPRCLRRQGLQRLRQLRRGQRAGAVRPPKAWRDLLLRSLRMTAYGCVEIWWNM